MKEDNDFPPLSILLTPSPFKPPYLMEALSDSPPFSVLPTLLCGGTGKCPVVRSNSGFPQEGIGKLKSVTLVPFPFNTYVYLRCARHCAECYK